MPMSASLIAMRSLAPSPTIPTPNELYFIILCIMPCLDGLYSIFYLLITVALFSGVILANTLIFEIGKDGHLLIKLLSTARTYYSELLKARVSNCTCLELSSSLSATDI